MPIIRISSSSSSRASGRASAPTSTDALASIIRELRGVGSAMLLLLDEEALVKIRINIFLT